MVPSRPVKNACPAAAIGDDLLACRRADAHACGPIDERFFGATQLATWWSLVLRDGPEVETADPEATDAEGDAGDDAPADAADGFAPARGALGLALPLDTAGRETHLPADHAPAEAARREKRDLYRVIDRFARREDLLDDMIAGA